MDIGKQDSQNSEKSIGGRTVRYAQNRNLSSRTVIFEQEQEQRAAE